MSFYKGLGVCLAVSSLLGCSAPAPPEKTVFEPLTQQRDRARDVQNTVDRNSDATRGAVDGQERGDSAPSASQDGTGRNRGDDRP